MKVYALLSLFFISALAQSQYFLGEQGESCAQTCLAQNMNCNNHIVTNNTDEIFASLGIKCQDDTDDWWAQDQPSYVSDSTDPNYGKCVGYTNVPSGVLCGGSFPTTRRLCACDAPSKTKTIFGTGVSNYAVGTTEQYIFQHFLAPGDYGVMTHFWFTLGNPGGDGLIIRYYVDGETNASLEFNPAMACGTGFNESSGAPWGTKWISKGSNDGSYSWNFRVPFQKSIVITAQHETDNVAGFYMIVRGSTNLPMNIGGIALPSTAKLNLFKNNAVYQPLEFVTLAQVPSGSGLVFMHTLAVQSGNLNFLEGCHHAFLDPSDQFPATVLSTGTEDYFDSGWYFNAGLFRLPVTGYTHYADVNNSVSLSAYRFHEMDPLIFNNGINFVWRNGDMYDATGVKCLIESGGTTVGSPTASWVMTYTWVYTW